MPTPYLHMHLRGTPPPALVTRALRLEWTLQSWIALGWMKLLPLVLSGCRCEIDGAGRLWVFARELA
jgi:hypothetical protein